MLHAPPEKRTLLLDFETFSATPLAHGTHTYADDSEIMVATYAVDDEEEVSCIDTTAGESLAPLIIEIKRADRIVIHNSYFDRTVAAAHGIVIPPEKIIDTMVLALMHSLPGSLDKLSEIYNLGEDKAKIKDGKRLIHLFCKPRPKKQKLRRATRETHPEDWAKFIEYAKMDIVSMRAIYKKLPRWNFTKEERDLWLLDQRINDRGIYVDCDLAKAALRTFDKQGLTLDERANEMTEGLVTSLSQRDRVLDYLNRDPEAFFINDLKKGTIADLLKEEELPDDIREMLTLRLEGASTSPTKYTALLRSTSPDSRLRGTTQFCGAARTGRWGGRIFQPHNLPRPKLKSGAIEIGIEAMKLGVEDLLFDNPTDLCVSAIRGVVHSAPENKLVIADLSNIEGRVLAWLAGEEWKVQAFIDYDNGVGPDLYMATYAKSFNVSMDAVIENEEHGDGKFRSIGKVLELACGFGGSVGAFASMGMIYNVKVPAEEALELVRAWRAAHPATTKFWYALSDAVWQCIEHPDDNTPVWKVRGIRIDRRKSWLRIQLPSGRYLCYPNIRIKPRKKIWTDIDGNQTIEWRDTICYDGVDPFKKYWGTVETYYGKIVENIVQATSRDILAHGMKLAEAEGAEIVLHVHDEIIAEVPDSNNWPVRVLEECMSRNPDWATGLPLAAKGFETHRYRKG